MPPAPDTPFLLHVKMRPVKAVGRLYAWKPFMLSQIRSGKSSSRQKWLYIIFPGFSLCLWPRHSLPEQQPCCLHYLLTTGPNDYMAWVMSTISYRQAARFVLCYFYVSLVLGGLWYMITDDNLVLSIPMLLLYSWSLYRCSSWSAWFINRMQEL